MDNKAKNLQSGKKPDPVIPNVTAEGSLGLLALGDVGLRVWRKKKKEALDQSKKSEK